MQESVVAIEPTGRFAGVQLAILADPIVAVVAEVAQGFRLPLYLVGGMIRDLFLKRRVKDYDFVAAGIKAPFLDGIRRALGVELFPLGKGHRHKGGVYRMVKGGVTIDISLLRGGIGEDLMDRDFTINAIAYAFDQCLFFAHADALSDLKRGRIASVSTHSIERDPLRMLRGIRYRCTLPGFYLAKDLKEEIASHKGGIRGIAAERVRGELDAIILSPHPAEGLLEMHELGLLSFIFPELVPLAELHQGRHHRVDALTHTIEVVGEGMRLAKGDNPLSIRLTDEGCLILGYAALFHDLGKPATQQVDQAGDLHFYGHPKESSKIASAIMRRLRFSNKLREGVLLLVENHMRILTLSTGSPTDKALRRLIHELGEEVAPLLLLGLADIGSKDRGEKKAFVAVCRRIWDLYQKEDLMAPEPLLRGRDLLALGFPPGPRMGKVLSEVRERQIAGELRSREEALRFVEEVFMSDG